MQHNGRSEKVSDLALDGNSPDEAADCPYDVENRWIGENIISPLPSGEGQGEGFTEHQIRFAYDGNQIVLQFDKDGSGQLDASNLSHHYTWQPGAVDQLMADEQTDKVVWTLGDNQGTIRDLAVMDSGVTSVANHRVFDSFGNLVSQTNSAVDCLFGYTGRAFDSNTGLQNNLNRWYDVSIGGWISKDPIGFGGGDTNLYRYVGNNPTNGSDPSGLQDPSGMVQIADQIAQEIEARAKKAVAATYGQLIKHCNGNTEALSELKTILNIWARTPQTYSRSGGWCGGWLDNFLDALPPIFRLKLSVLKLQPVWLVQGSPSLRAGYGMVGGGAWNFLTGNGYVPTAPGHYAVRVTFPDGFVVYLDNGWAGTGGLFTLGGSVDVPAPKTPLRFGNEEPW
jgi:RHS repeat-associated protein